jgi:Na+/H+-dicarboxylate symporter
MNWQTQASIYGMMALLVLAFFFCQAFVSAYRSEDKTVMVAINNFNEATIEIIAGIILLPLMLFHIYDYWRLAATRSAPQ